MTETLFSTVPLFEGLSFSQVPELHVARLAGSETATSLGDGGERVFLVLRGTLVRHVDGRSEQYDAGEVLGLEGISGPDPREQSVSSRGAAEWVELPARALRSAAGHHQRLRTNLWIALLHRTRELERALGELREALDDSRRQAAHDGLTHVYNRRWLEENLPRLLGRTTPERPLSVVMVDVDHFKRLNDTVGHAAGDRVLVAIADTLRRRFRPADLVARYGGEEFAVLMPATDLRAARRAAERVREAIAFTRFAGHDGGFLPAVTVSCGVATSRDAEVAQRLLERADGAMYKAKAAGRNRVVCSEPPEPGAE